MPVPLLWCVLSIGWTLIICRQVLRPPYLQSYFDWVALYALSLNSALILAGWLFTRFYMVFYHLA